MNTLKNILFIYDYNFVNGGGAQVAILTANAFAELGYTVHFLSAVSRPAVSQLSPKIIQHTTNQFDILTHPSPFKAIKQGIWNVKAAKKLTSLLKELNPQETIIHLHGWIKSLSPSIGKVLNQSAFPVVCTLHDYFVACPNGGFYNYQQQKICHLTPLSRACISTHCDARSYSHKLWRVARQYVQKHFSGIPSKIKHYIIPTRFCQNILQAYLPATSKIYNISNPIQSIYTGNERANIYTRRLLIVGRISKEKGVHVACEAARIAGVPLTVIGEGDQKKLLQQQYPEVDFKGWLSAEEVYREMQQSTALVFPSICYETQGLVVLEALSAGLPVIVSDKCAASEYINGMNGLLFESNNFTDLSVKITNLFNDMDKTDAMSKYAQEYYRQQPFSIDQYINQLTKLFSTIVNSQ